MNTGRKIAISINKVAMVSFLGTILFFFPDSTYGMPGMVWQFGRIVDYLTILFSFYIIIEYYLLARKDKKQLGLLLGFVALVFVFFLSGLVNWKIVETFRYVLGKTIPMIGMVCMVESGIIRDPLALINGMYINLYVLCIFNFVLTIMYPDGLYRNMNYTWSVFSESVFFLGTKNTMTGYYYTAIVLLGVKAIMFNKRLHFWDYLFVILFWFEMLHVRCTLGIACCVMMTILIFLVLTRRNLENRKNSYINSSNKRAMMKTAYVIIMLLQLLLLFSEAIISRFSDVVQKYFKKAHSVNVRQVIWNGAISQIVESPILGKSVSSVASTYLNVPWYAHNGYLDVALKAGVIGIIVMMIIHGMSMNYLSYCTDERLTLWCFGAFATLLIMSSIEGPFLSYKYIIILPIMYHASTLADFYRKSLLGVC